MAILEARSIVKVFSEGREPVPVLRGCSLRLEPGEILALEGPSGSGKTTLLMILGCLLTPTSGELQIAGEAVERAEWERHRRRSIGFVFQQYHLFPALTAVENVEYALNIKGVRGAEARKQAARWIDQVGLGDRSRFLPRDLSGGQKQRVAIARALAGDPPILLADEPTASLDSKVGLQLLGMFRDLARRERRGLVIVTHDPKVRDYVDRVVKIEDGLLSPGPDVTRPPARTSALADPPPSAPTGSMASFEVGVPS